MSLPFRPSPLQKPPPNSTIVGDENCSVFLSCPSDPPPPKIEEGNQSPAILALSAPSHFSAPWIEFGGKDLAPGSQHEFRTSPIRRTSPVSPTRCNPPLVTRFYGKVSDMALWSGRTLLLTRMKGELPPIPERQERFLTTLPRLVF